MAKHALLSASGSDRWFKCPPSALLEAEIEEKSSEYAREGTFAHALAELKLAHYLKNITELEYRGKAKGLKQDRFYSQELEDDVQIYVDFAIEKINEARARTKDAVVLLEAKLDYSPWVREGFGTGDLVLVTDDVLEVVDLKFGRGVQVSAVDNSQMRLYALGAINQFSVLYNINTVKMTIHQPRLDNISTAEMPVTELLHWGELTAKPLAELAFRGEGEFKPGEHCRFCKVRFTCRARAEEHLKLAGHDFKKPPLLTEEEIIEILAISDALQSWVSDVQAYALDQAVNHNKDWPGYKLIEGRSYRRYENEAQAAEVLMAAGFGADKIYAKKLLGITAMERLVGKEQFNELLGPYIKRPPGKPKLVSVDDKRPEIKSTAEIDFKEDL
jgi:hypothetical protein